MERDELIEVAFIALISNLNTNAVVTNSKVPDACGVLGAELYVGLAEIVDGFLAQQARSKAP